MKIAVCSDLHLEFAPVSLENTENADVLILSGDICVAKYLRSKDDYEVVGKNDNNKEFHTFFQECCARFPHVIYVMGNHEHYHGDYAKSVANLREHLGYLHNLHILDKEFVDLNGVIFAGGTLWTDMNDEDMSTMKSIRSMMNDFRIVENSNNQVQFKSPVYGRKEDGSMDFNNIVSMEFHTRNGKLTPEEVVVDHKAMLKFLGETLGSRPEAKVVVVGHHAPSKQSTKPQYEHDWIMNGGYSSDLTEFILNNPQIKLWTHGHTHHEFDYMVGSTRIVCNPRGYDGYEDQADNFKLKFVEI